MRKWLIDSLKPLACILIVMTMLFSGLLVAMGSSDASDGGYSSELGAGAVPTAPLNLVADRGPGYVWLWWDHPASNGDSLIKKYYIYRATTSGGQGDTPIDWTYVGNTSYYGTDLGGINFYNDTNVVLGTTYYYKLKASSDAGNSSFSNEASATPSLTGDTPGAPGIVGQNDIYAAQVNWTVPIDQGSTPVRFYFVYRDPALFMFNLVEDWYRETGYRDEASFWTELGTEYNYTVTAVNSYGQGTEASTDVTIGGTAEIPTEPLNLVSIGFNNSVLLGWDAPADPSNTGFTNYNLYRSPTGTGDWTLIDTINVPAFTGYYGFTADDDVVNGQTYYYTVSAENGVGEGGFSNVANATPEAIVVPFLIDELTAYPGDDKVLLMWDVAQNETDYADAYDIYRGTTSGSETLLVSDVTGEHYFDDTVVNGQIYYYKVKPKIEALVGPFSPEASATPNPGPAPAAPTGLVATPGPYGTVVYLPEATPISILIGYEVYRGTSSGAQDPTPIEVVEEIDQYGTVFWQDSTAEPDVNYFYTIKLRNMYGLSDSSNEATSFSSPTGDVPDAVTDLSASGGANQITLQWSSPDYPGTATLLYYEVQRNDTEGGWDTIEYMELQPVGDTQFVDEWVIPGVTYQYRVVANNEYGDGSGVSNEASASASGGAGLPSAPHNLETQTGTGYVLLNWDPPSDLGTPSLSGYRIYRATNSGGYGAPIATVNAATTSYNDTSPVAGTPYFYIVKAYNSAGDGPASNEVTATVVTPGSAPGIPTNLAAEGAPGSIVLTWNEPVGGNVDKYLIYRGTTAGGEGATPIATVTGRTYTDDSVTVGVPYFYKIRANNSYGESALSAEVSATATVVTEPSAPRNLEAEAKDGKIALSWEAPSEDGGSAITGYDIYRAVEGGSATKIATVGADTLSYEDDSVTVGTNYTYTVKAVNAVGAGPASASVTSTPNEGGGGDNTMLYVAGGVGAAAVIGVLGYLFLRKKK